MKFSQDTFDYLSSMADKAKAVASALNVEDVTAQGILGAVGEEYEALGVVDWVQTQRVSTYTHEEIKSNYEKIQANPSLLEEVVTASKLRKVELKWDNPVLNDVGPGNVKVHTAIELLNKYVKNESGDPLGIKLYSNDYAKLASDLSDESSDLSLKFAGLMLKEASEFYRSKTEFAWSTYDQDTKDAVLITYYNIGVERSSEKIDTFLNVFPQYFPGPGGGTSGGEVYLENSDKIKELIGLSPSSPTQAKSFFELNINNAPNVTEKGTTDHDAYTAQVTAGLVGSGGSWKLSYDPNKLNLNQYQGNWIDNTFTATATQILADGYRPGNGNTVKEVFDFSLRNATQGLSYDPSKFGALLNSGNAQARLTLPTDPLVLDLNGDGVRLTDYVSAPVLFDIDNDGGSLEETGWVSSGDGIVVVDRDGNGKIDHIGETLSEYFGGATGSGGNAGEKRFKNGFDALKSLDSNGDDVFDDKDDAWSSVKVWVDANHDGKSWDDANGNGALDAGEASELKSLSALGITQINLTHTEQSGEVRDGNEVLASGTFVQEGITKEAIAANFLANPNGHTFTASGTGTIVSTQGGGQVAPVSAYTSSSGAGETIDVAQKGVNNATGGSGNDILLGDAGTNWLAGGQGSDTFNAGAGDDVLLIDADDLQANIHGDEGTDIVQVVGDKGVVLNLAQAEVEIAQGGRGNDVFIGGGLSTVYMRGGDGDDVLIGGAANDALSGENGDDVIIGGAGNDVLRGHRGGDQILGELGNDLIDGGLDDDYLSGGAGDDVLIGGAGDDTLEGGEGTDVIELSGEFSEYRFTKTQEGVWISDTVAGRDGTDFVKNVEKANFKSLKLVDIPSNSSEGLESPLPAKDVLDKDKSGAAFGRTSAHLIDKEQLLRNDIDWQNDALHITELFDVTGGTATLTQAGDVLFTPDADFAGVMSFKYSVADAKGNAAATIVDTGSGESATMRAAVFLKTPELPDDPLVTDQWYLSQANILPVWADYTGKGVRIGQFETNGPFGTTKEILDYRHADLKENIDQAWLANATPGQMAGEGSGGKFSDHATLVAGVMVAARNGEGGVGVAYDATIAGHWINKDDFSSLNYMRQYDVVNNSWGSSNRFDLRFSPAELGLMPEAHRRALSEGRDGLGTVIVTGAGNDRELGGNANYSNVSNSRSSIVVGAINATTDVGALQLGGKPFSSPGASILVSAPGSNVTSTSRLVQNDNGSTFGADTSVSQGTSFATPIVSGIVALMLEANSALGYRDVQQILALSAKKVADASTTWQDNGSGNWNGGGMHVSHDYGYGEVDARAAVRLAETWNTQQTYDNEYRLVTPLQSGVLNNVIPDGQSSGLNHTLTVGGVDLLVEHAEVRVTLTHARPGDLIIKLISPSGTESVLMNRPGKAPGSAATERGDADFAGSHTLDYVFDTALLRGEHAAGNWTLQVIDTVTGDTGTLNSWSLNVYGQGETVNDQYVYTNEYAQLAVATGRNVLSDTDGGEDTLNVAAISSASRIDLAKGEATLAGAGLTIQNPGQIENAIGGEFGDELIGNAAANKLLGGRGDDVLSGGAGIDLLLGGQGSDTLIGGTDTDYFVIDKHSGEIDTIGDFQVGTDRLVLSGFDASIHSSLTLQQQGLDTLIGLPDGQFVRLINVSSAGLSIDSVVYVEDGVSLSQLSRYSGHGFGNDGTIAERVLPDAAKGVIYWANSAGERVFGGAGDDAIYGGLGNDVLVGDNSTDAVAGGNDSLHGGAGSDVVRGGAGNDVLQGGTGLDYLGGDAGDDILYLEGDQGAADYAATTFLSPKITIDGASLTGAAVAGGAGNDRFVVVEEAREAASQGLMANLIEDLETGNPNEKIDLSRVRAVRAFSDLVFSELTINGQQYLRVWLGAQASGTQYLTLKGVKADQLSAANFIFSTAGEAPKVLIAGTDVDDRLIGDAGGNTLDGGKGADILEGRTGDDTYIVDNTGDVVREVVGGGHDIVKASVSYALPDDVEVLELTGSASINGTGNELANRLVGNAADNILDGGAGSDVLVGGLGNDTYIVDDGADRVLESIEGGIDTIQSSVSFTLASNLENLVLTGAAAINATGNSADNSLTGNAADNRIDGAQGADLMAGGGGDDTYFVDQVDDVVKEKSDEGFDKVVSMVDFTLSENVEALVLSASALNGVGNALDNELTGNTQGNRLSGGAGNDWLSGEGGNDTLIGGTGNDVLQGGAGNDRFVFDHGDGQDRIIEDLASTGGIDSIVLGAGIDETDVAVDHSEQGMVLRLRDGQQITSAWTAAGGHAIERIEFANGKVWDTATLDTLPNRLPILSTDTADQTATEDAPFNFTLPAGTFSDADAGDALSLTAKLASGQPLPAWLSFDAATRTFSGTPVNNDVGALSVLVTATDKAGASVSDAFAIQVVNVNDAPVLAATAVDQTATEDALFSFTLPSGMFTDADVGDSLSLTAKLANGQPLPAWLSFDAATRTFSGTPVNNDVGELSVLVTATDKAGASVSGAFAIQVVNVNDAPVLAMATADQTATEDAPFSFTLPAGTFSDADAGDALILTARLANGQPLPAWLSFDAASRTFSGTPVNNDVGALSVLVTATDKAGLVVSDTFDIEVANTNDAPEVAQPISDQRMLLGQSLSYELPVGAFSDVDKGDQLTYLVTLADGSALPDWLTFDAATRSLSGVPSDVGTIALKVTAVDKAGTSVSDVFDIVVGSPSAVTGTEGADTLRGTDLADTIDALGGNDTLYGQDGNDGLNGGGGNDQLYGGNGDDVLDGGAGNDTLYGNAGNDTYSFYRGMDQDTIDDYDWSSGNIDTIKVAADIAPADIAVSRTRYDLYLTLNGTADKITIRSHFSGSRDQVERVEFADGTVWDLDTLEAMAKGVATNSDDKLFGEDALSDTLSGLEGDDELYGLEGNDTLLGGAGSDRLYGGDGDDVLDGGAGNDSLSGDSGNDTYSFYRGMGQDTVNEYDWTAGNIDTIKVAADIAPTDIAVSRTRYDLYLTLNGTADKITVRSHFSNSNYQVERVEFADGTVWDLDTLEAMASGVASEGGDTLFGDDAANVLDGLGGNDTLYGLDGNDVLRGGEGSDRLYGGDGDDVLDGGQGNDSLSGDFGNDAYSFYRGMGQDTITEFDWNVGNIDTIKVTADIAPTDIAVSRTRYDLFLTLKGTADKITVRSHFSNSNYQVERVEFADGTVWDLDTLKTLASGVASEGGDTLFGDDAADVLDGLGGNDTLYGQAGNDVLNGGTGSDQLYGGDGDDVLDGGAGNDSLSGDSGNDTYSFYRGMGQDTVNDYDRTAGNVDTIKVAADIAPADIVVTRDAYSLYLTLNGTADKITVRSHFSSSSDQVERVEFADGTVWDIDTLKTMASGVASEAADSLFGDDAANVLDGLGGDDTLYGQAGNDALNGGGDNDQLYGGDGDDVLDGGAGSDTLYGNAGNDTYSFYRGMGQDTVNEYDWAAGNIDTIKVAADIAPTDIVVTRDAYELFLVLKGTTDKITVRNHFSGSYYQVERVEFTDGTVWDIDTLKTMASGVASEAADSLFGDDAADVLDGLGGNDTLYGQAGNDVLRGGAGNDQLYGGDGDDVLDGGAGNDTLYGNAGNDTYSFYRGMGQNTINDYDRTAGNVDTIKVAADIAPADIVVTRDAYSLYLALSGATDKITVRSHFSSSSDQVERVEFADGTVWDIDTLKTMASGVASEAADILFGDDAADVLDGLGGNDTLYGQAGNDVLRGGAGNDQLYGGDGDDVLDGGAGNDTLYGNAGNDTYSLYRGMGQDTINDYVWGAGSIDTIKVAADIAPTDIAVSRTLYDLYLTLSGATDKITVRSHFGGSSDQVERVEFADGTVWDIDTLKAMTKGVATNGNDKLFGEDALSDTLSGLEGDDELYGLEGNDTLLGGAGVDHLYGGYGGDRLEGGAGNDYLDGDRGGDTYVFNRGDGQDIIDDFDPYSGETDMLLFGSNIAAEQLWFRQDGWDLEVSVIGTSDKVVVEKWDFWGAGSWEKAQHIEQFRTADGKVLLASQVDQLVEAMAAFAPPAAGQTSLPPDYKESLNAVIATNWQ